MIKLRLALLVLLTCEVVTAQTLTDIAANQNITHIQSSANHWANGGSFYDFDNDGWDDLVLPVTNDSLVFYHNNAGALEQIGSYVYAPGAVRQITWVDYNNDGTLDLFVTFHDIGVRLYENDGNFNFTDVTSAVGISTAPFSAYGVAFADADGDGDLDFYVCAYETVQVHGPNASHNLYYINQNNQSFIESAVNKGIDNGAQPSFMPVWFDYDNDNDLDLHIINDREYAGNAFFENVNGSFIDVTMATGLHNYGHNPMSNSIADFDNDADFDIFESDVANGAISNGTPVDYKLYSNQNGVFTNIAGSMGVDTNYFAWGSLWVDYDNDCFEDLYIATSFTDAQIFNERSSVFYHNDGGLGFTDYTDSVTGDLICSSYSPLKGDLNNDGFYDIIVVNDGVPQHVFSNSGNTNNHIKITPKGSVSNLNAIGARVEVFANGQHQTQMVFCGDAMCAQNSQHKIFGLGSAMVVDSVIITFPSGIVMKEYDLLANENYQILEQSTVNIPLIQGVNVIQKCVGDTVLLHPAGYTNYLWNTGATTPSIQVTNSGYYSYQAENLVGDTLFQSNELYVHFNGPLSYQEIITNANCGNPGAAEIVPTQSNLVDSIYWSDNFVGALHPSLPAGTYEYTITSIYGCVQTDSLTINDTPLFNTQYLTTPSSTTTPSGTVQFFVWGGTPPFTYTIGAVSFSDYITDLAPGVYVVVITDALGCSDTIPVTIDATGTSGISEFSSDDLYAYITDQQLYICFESAAISPENVTVFDLTGQEVLDHQWNQQDVNCLHRNCALPSGVYQIRVVNENAVYTKTVFNP